MGVFHRLRAAFARNVTSTLDPARPDLVVVVSGFDPVQACSAALHESSSWLPERPAVLRHHLQLPACSVPRAIALAAQEGYTAVQPVGGGDADLVLARVQVLDALHCSQERSRMVGLAQRLGGQVLGWDGLQPRATDAYR